MRKNRTRRKRVAVPASAPLVAYDPLFRIQQLENQLFALASHLGVYIAEGPHVVAKGMPSQIGGCGGGSR